MATIDTFAEAEITSVTPNVATQFGIVDPSQAMNAASCGIECVGGNPALAQLAAIVAEQANDRVPPVAMESVQEIGSHAAAIVAERAVEAAQGFGIG